MRLIKSEEGRGGGGGVRSLGQWKVEDHFCWYKFYEQCNKSEEWDRDDSQRVRVWERRDDEGKENKIDLFWLKLLFLKTISFKEAILKWK